MSPPKSEAALSCVASHALFPGRTVLYVREVAEALRVSVQHIFELIEEYRDSGGKSGLAALDISNGRKSPGLRKGNKTTRAGWRVPVSSFDDYVRRAAGLPSTK